MVRNYKTQVQRACEATEGMEFEYSVVDICECCMVEITPPEYRRKNKKGSRQTSGTERFRNHGN